MAAATLLTDLLIKRGTEADLWRKNVGTKIGPNTLPTKKKKKIIQIFSVAASTES